MENSRSAWWPWVLAIALLYWALVFISTHLPAEALPDETPPDKLLHVLGYGGLTFLLGAAEVLRCRRTLPVYGRVMTIAAIYAALDEISQTLVPGRYGNVADWLADVSGAALGIALLAALVCIATRGKTGGGQQAGSRDQAGALAAGSEASRDEP